MEEVKCPYCGGIRRRQVFWVGASCKCLKCGARGEYDENGWRWSVAHLTLHAADEKGVAVDISKEKTINFYGRVKWLSSRR